LFFTHILEFIASCKADGYEIVLYIDANEHVYTGRLAKALSNDDFNMEEQFFSLTGTHAPASHSDGSRPITGLFATAGVQFLHIYQSRHKSGLGDHRFTVFDVDATSVLGVPLRHAKRPSTRPLRMNAERNVIKFNNKLEKLVDQHRMFKKLTRIHSNAPLQSESVTTAQFNKWDMELEEYIKHSERKACCKIFSGQHGYSPELSLWISRSRFWDDVRSHMLSPIRDPRNLYCRLRSEGYQFSDLTIEIVDAKIAAVANKLQWCKQNSPQLRDSHLDRRLEIATSKGDEAAIKAITAIIKKEASRKDWSACRRSQEKSRGRSVLSVQTVDSDGLTHTKDTQAEVEAAAAAELNPRFRLANTAPIFHSELIDHTGPMGELPAVKHILRGTFDFPPDTDPWTRAIIQE
ncbi:MAG: hypothetical protein ACO3PX_18315, partial [bacterium]